MPFTRHAWPAILAALILTGIPATQAQSTTSGYVTGSVTDSSKAVIAPRSSRRLAVHAPSIPGNAR
jgi:hypothetical protein